MRKLVVASAFAVLTVLVAPLGAITGHWVKDNEHPFVGLAVFYDATGEFAWRCSGTLLSPTVFLTAPLRRHGRARRDRPVYSSRMRAPLRQPGHRNLDPVSELPRSTAPR